MVKRKQLIKRAKSQDALRTFTWNKDQATVYPDFSFDAVLNMVNNDPVARGAVNHYVDKAMEGDYAILKVPEGTYDPDFELVLDQKYQFRTDVLRKIFLMLKLFNNCYIEIVRDTDNRTKALNVLDTLNIEPITEPNGDPLKYKSRTPHPKTGRHPEWSKDDIVWIKMGDRSTGFAPVDLRALWESLCAKDYIRRYVAWLWQTGQYRLIYNFENASDKDIGDFLAYARKHDDNFKVPFITKGKMETKLLRDMAEIEALTELLKYWDGQTLIALRVPPIDAGIPDASGRASADAQGNSLSTHVTSVKKIVEDKISYDLFPRISKSNNTLRFAPNDRFAEKMILENVQMMKAVGMTDEVIAEYMSDKGFVFKTTTLFVDPVEQAEKMAVATAAGQPDNPRELDTAPSRQGKSPGTGNQKQSSPTTRPDQLRKS